MATNSKDMQQTTMSIINEDLEDGEIETDEENGESEEAIKPTKLEPESFSNRKKSRKSSEDSNKSNIDSKIAKVEVGKSASAKVQSSKKSNSTQAEPNVQVKATANDDFMGNIEKAIANALKKDGIEPKIPKMSSKQDENPEEKHRKSRRRKRHSTEKQPRKKVKTNDDTEKHAKYESDDVDEYEMLNMRGGSPVSGQQAVSGSHGQQTKAGQLYYDSDGSYTSFDSYESAESVRKRHQRSRRNRDRAGRKRRSNSKNKRDKRRRFEDSDQDVGPSERGDTHRDRDRGNNGGGGGRNNNNNGPRKAELCKFYLMECCAKGENCLYMHGDFPCKYYYLGMKNNHNRETCKFSHGKPLSDQLRNVLLKHLETAPKEIIGDFPRMPRENVISLLNAQHQKLLTKYGMESETGSMNQTNVKAQSSSAGQISLPSGNALKIPSLMDLVTKFPEQKTDATTYSNPNPNNKNRKNDKPRRSRWCEQKLSDSHSAPVNIQNNEQSSNIQKTSETQESVDLKALAGILTPEELEKLSKTGIETVTQLTQLTVLQVIELGLSIAQISEIQLKAQNIQKYQIASKAQTESSVSQPATESIVETVVTTIPAVNINKDQDMRIPMQQPSIERPKSSSNNILNQDIDMRILTIPPPIPIPQKSISAPLATEQKVCLVPATLVSPELGTVLRTQSPTAQKSDVGKGDYNSYIKNTQYKRQNDQKSSNLTQPPKIDYSQYLRDANLDLNQADLDDALDDENVEKLSTKLAKAFENYYDADEIESSLIIEEPPLQIDENCRDDAEIESEQKKQIPLMDSGSECDFNSKNEIPSNSSDELSTDNKKLTELNPASYAPASVFPMTVANKIDLSSSVSQYLLTNNDSEKSASDVPIQNNNRESEEQIDCGENASAFYRQDPRTSTNITSTTTIAATTTAQVISNDDSSNPAGSFEFFSRQITDANYSLPNVLDEKNSSEDNTEDNLTNKSAPKSSPPSVRKSIYEWSGSDNENDDNSRSARRSSGSSDDDDDSGDARYPHNTSRKDKDMRISTIFLENDYSNGDIDLRLPFKPVMANYIPATEIDASITSHAPIVYKVKEVDIPKPDYSELRRSIPSHENTLDPRLRRILKIREDSADTDIVLANTIKSPTYSSPNTSQLYLDTEVVIRPTSSKLSDLPMPNIAGGNDIICKPRIDPRRPNVQMTSNTVSGNIAATVSQQQQNPVATQQSPQLSIQNILQKSNWYQNCSSKQKIMVNQQLAIVSTELKKFHADTSPNKIFDLQFIIQNQVLQNVLTNLGIYINDMGEFVQLSGSGPMPNSDNMNNANGSNSGIVDLMSIPIGNNLDMNMDFMRNQQHALQQAMSGNAAAYMGAGPAVPPPLLRFPGIPNEVMRPGLLGMAPNIPLPTPFNLFESHQSHPNNGPNNFENFFNRNNLATDNIRPGNQNANNNSNRNNFRTGGGSRWSANCISGNNNVNRDLSMRRNQFDNRNNSRREKK